MSARETPFFRDTENGFLKVTLINFMLQRAKTWV
jgi:hypothetical protein